MAQRPSNYLRLLGLLIMTAVLASATTLTFYTPAGSQVTGPQPVNAVADFTFSDGSLTITLYNEQTDIRSVVQNISSLSFLLEPDLSTSSLGYSSLAPDKISVASGGAALPWVGGGSSTNWVLQDLGAGLLICAVCPGGTPGAPGPADTIIGPAGTLVGGAPGYPSAGGSIAGNGPHSPFLQYEASFTLTNSLITPNTTVSNVTFGFGTTWANTVDKVPGDPGEVPEPGSALLGATGLLLLLAGGYKRFLAHNN